MALRLTMHAIAEARPGPRWQGLFRTVWPAYRRWYLRDGAHARPQLARAREALGEHMPELVPTWRRLTRLAGEDELAARMLTLYDPPRYVAGCTQAVFRPPAGTPLLVRNYDYAPELFERVVYWSAFVGGRVIGTGDCMWGLLDGINESGLAVSMTFGGRRVSGPGFGIQLVVRYLLETCATVQEGKRALDRLPVQGSYNLTLLDRSGAAATVWVGPDHVPELAPQAAATNHQARIEWVEYARWTRTLERRVRLEQLLGDADCGEEPLIEAFLRPPLRADAYAEGLGTLYTAVMRPSGGSLEYRWPGSTWRHDLAQPRSGTHMVTLAEASAA